MKSYEKKCPERKPPANLEGQPAVPYFWCDHLGHQHRSQLERPPRVQRIDALDEVDLVDLVVRALDAVHVVLDLEQTEDGAHVPAPAFDVFGVDRDRDDRPEPVVQAHASRRQFHARDVGEDLQVEPRFEEASDEGGALLGSRGREVQDTRLVLGHDLDVVPCGGVEVRQRRRFGEAGGLHDRLEVGYHEVHGVIGRQVAEAFGDCENLPSHLVVEFDRGFGDGTGHGSDILSVVGQKPYI